MSVFNSVIDELYPNQFRVGLVADRVKIAKWCRDNDIIEFDISNSYSDKVREGYSTKDGYIVRFAHLDEWLLAKLRWS